MTKTRMGPLSIDGDITGYLEELWREEIDGCNRRGERIPSFSYFMNRLLKEWVTQHRLKKQ